MKTPKQNNQLAPVVLWKNQNAIIEMEGKLNSLLELAAKLATEYFKLPFAKQEAELGYMLNDTAADLKAYHLSLIPDSLELGTLRLNKEAAIKAGLFQEPNFPEFNTARVNLINAKFLEYQSYFKIKDQAAIINPETWAAFVSRHNISASTADELEMYQVWTDFLNSAMALDKYFRKNVDMVLMPEGLAPIQLNRLALPLVGGGLAINHTVFQALSKRLAINRKK